MSPLKVLVTGAQGFVGRYLVQALLRHEHEVVTAGHRCAYDIDLTDKLAVFRCMKEVRPDAVVHLAAVSNVPYAWEHPAQAVEVNVSASIYLLEAFAQMQPQGTFLFVGSSDAYGLTAKAGRPLVETDLCQPQNPYAISKLCAELRSTISGRDRRKALSSAILRARLRQSNAGNKSQSCVLAI